MGIVKIKDKTFKTSITESEIKERVKRVRLRKCWVSMRICQVVQLLLLKILWRAVIR